MDKSLAIFFMVTGLVIFISGIIMLLDETAPKIEKTEYIITPRDCLDEKSTGCYTIQRVYGEE